MELSGRKVLVLGLGVTGLSAVRWLAAHGAAVSVADTRPAPPNADALASEFPGVPLAAGPFRAADFRDADLVVASPGVPLAEPEVAAAAARGVPVVGDVELFARALHDEGPVAPVIGITGSNGKSTVTAMCGDMCRAAGLDTVVAGNIGLPVLDALSEVRARGRRPGAWVLELSSFQLETTASLDCASATVLNLSEDHLDRYAGMDGYAAAKARIFRGSGAQVLNREDLRVSAMALPGRERRWFGLLPPRDADDFGLAQREDGAWLAEGETPLMPVTELPVAGLHNAANALAALALTRVLGLRAAPLLEGLRAFRGLPHRVEKVREIAGVAFYDDSKGTNVGSTLAALEGLGGVLAPGARIALIAGGDGKGQDFGPLAGPVARHTRVVTLIGRDGPRLGAVLAESRVPLLPVATVEEAVRVCFEHARPGDAVLLSPACASLDMFRNYEHRAQVFVAAVNELAARREAQHG